MQDCQCRDSNNQTPKHPKKRETANPSHHNHNMEKQTNKYNFEDYTQFAEFMEGTKWKYCYECDNKTLWTNRGFFPNERWSCLLCEDREIELKEFRK